MKKIITLLLACLMVFTLAGCSKTTDEGTTTETETVELYKGKYMDLLPDDKREEVYSYGLNLSDNEIALLGTKMDKFTFTSYEGESVTLPEKGPYIFEIVGSWCSYCQALSVEIIDDEIYKDIPIYQYFMMGTQSESDSFYATIEKDRPEEITVLMQNEEFEKFLNTNEFYSVPLSFFVDEDGNIALSHLGYVDAATYRNIIDYAKTAKLYNVEVSEGKTLREYVELQQKARTYIDELPSIDIPVEYLNQD